MRLKTRQTILLLFSCIIITTLSLFLCLYLFLQQSPTTTSSFAVEIIQPNNQLPHVSAFSKNILTSQDLLSYFDRNLAHTLPYLALSLILIITISFLFFTYLLQRMNKKQHFEIAQSIAKLKDVDVQKGDDFYYELSQIKEWMDQYQNDYKRLHAYMTHEQKNMIMLMKARASTKKDPQLSQDIQHLQNSMEDVLTLFAQDEETLEELDFSIIAAEICDQYRSMYPSLTFCFGEECDYHMMGKEYWLKRALANILDNAIKYGEQKEILVHLSVHKQTIQCKVIDHGCGIPQKQLQEIFSYRYRIHPLQKNGFGIGLSLVMHVCDLCDGYVWVDSKEAKGSCFQLCFPTKH